MVEILVEDAELLENTRGGTGLSYTGVLRSELDSGLVSDNAPLGPSTRCHSLGGCQDELPVNCSALLIAGEVDISGIPGASGRRSVDFDRKSDTRRDKCKLGLRSFAAEARMASDTIPAERNMELDLRGR